MPFGGSSVATPLAGLATILSRDSFPFAPFYLLLGCTAMDRRTLFAFVLIGVVIFLMPHYLRWLRGDEPPPYPEVAEQAPGEVDRSASGEAPARARVSEPEVLPETRPPVSEELQPAVSDSGLVARHVVVETELYVATFTTRGARLVSFVLKDFRDRRGGWLELVPPGGYGLGMSLSRESLDRVVFQANREQLSLDGAEQGEVVFAAQMGNRRVLRRLRFQGDRYRFSLEVSVSGVEDGTKVVVNWVGGLAATEGDVAQDAPYMKIGTRVGGEVQNWDVGDLGPDADPLGGAMSWVGVRSKYFVAAMITPEGRRFDLNLEGEQKPSGVKHFSAEVVAEDRGEPLRLGVFVGPVSYDILRAQDLDLNGSYRELALDEMMDYGWAFLRPIMKPVTILILRAFLALHQVIPNYGLVIISFSLLVKVVLFPLTHKSLEASAKMQQIQPQMTALKEKYSDDQQKLNQEMMKLYKDQKVNPLGGCLPLVFQMPILFSLFNVFRGAIELRQAGFVLWMTDLSQPDRLLVGGVEVHVLPLLMAASMFLQQKMTMKDPKQAAMVYVMPVLMTFFFWSMSSGLVLYWTMFNVLTLVQQHVMEYTKSVLGTK